MKQFETPEKVEMIHAQLHDMLVHQGYKLSINRAADSDTIIFCLGKRIDEETIELHSFGLPLERISL